MNHLTTKFNEDSRSGVVRLHGKTVRDHLPPTYADSYGAVLLDRPLFVAAGEASRFADDLTKVFAILTSLPQRLFDGDLRRYAAGLGMDPGLVDLMLIGATGRPPLYARADAYHDGTSFKLLELNVGSELGGIDTAQVNRAYLAVDSFRAFAQRHRLGFTDTAERVAAALRRAAAPVTDGDPVVALIEGRGGLAEHDHVFVAIQEALRRYGIDVLLGEIDQLGSVNGKLTLHGRPLDVLLRYFASGQIVGSADRARLERIVAADAAGKTALFHPLEGALFASKGSLGALHEPRMRQLLTPEERRVVDRVVPWTRVISGATGSLSGADWYDLVAHCREHRESLVLKPGIGYGGVGVVIGREVTDQVWLDRLAEVRSLDYVVQQVVTPAAEPVLNPETGEPEDWHANWGIFVDEGGYGGGFVRALRGKDGSVISYSNPGTRGTCVFTYPDPAPPDVTS